MFPSTAEGIVQAAPKVLLEPDMTDDFAASRDQRPWLDRLRTRDADAFDALVIAEYDRIAQLAGRLVAWQGDLDDIVQEVFARAWERIESFRGDSQVNTWLGGITVNVCRSVRRRQAAWKIFQRDLGAVVVARQLFQSQEENKTADQELVATGLQRLRQVDREMIVLRWLERRDVDEIATLLGLRKSVVEVRLHRAKDRLRRILEKLSE